jgi:fermentation-respiration switch protein FrsA (DUF1100 family)
MRKRSPKITNRKRKVLKFLVILFFLIFNIVGIITGNIVYDKVTKAKIDRTIDNYEYYKNTFDYERFMQLDTEEVKIKSNFGYNLSGTYIKNSVKTRNTMVVVHGFRGTRWESMKYADMYLDLGYNVLIYDSRYHGNSEGKDITLGYMEKSDLDNCVKWVNKKNAGGIIGVHGESLGGVTALLHSKKNEESKLVKFYIADCAYSDLREMIDFLLKENLKYYNSMIGKFVSFYCNVVAFVRSGFTLYSISPISAIKDVETPIMFIHGVDDEYIPPSMSIDMYRLKKGKKSIYIAPASGHSQAYLFNKEEYTNKVKIFIEQALEK